MLQLYRRSPLWGVALPGIAAIYTAFTIESAIQHWRGRGGAWKGRFQASRGSGGGRRDPLPHENRNTDDERGGASFGALRA
jgi:hypothetical protein